jgi:hypothetical protein
MACLTVCLLLALFGPASALAEVSDPFSGVPNPSTSTTATVAASTSSEESGSLSLSSSVVLIAVIAGALLLGGIAFLIVRDARSVAPVGEGGVTGRSAGDTHATLRKRRAKAKAGRQSRKRNQRKR